MSTKRAYAGNARFIEIGSPGVPFRYLINVDHLEGVRFEQILSEDDDGQVVSHGWSVVLLMQGKANGLNFPDIEPAIACYNMLLSEIQGAGVPLVTISKLRPPEKPSPIVDADGKTVDAVRAAIDAGDELPPLSDEELDELTSPEE